MNDDTTTEVVDQVEQEAPETAPESTEGDDTGQQDGKSTREAKYRTRLRETEAERDALAGRLEAMQRQHIETMLDGVSPKAFWLFNTDLAVLLTEDGIVDSAKVKEALHTTRRELGIQMGTYVPGEGNQPSFAPKAVGFSDAFAPKVGR